MGEERFGAGQETVFTAPNPEYFMETLRLRLGFNTDSVRRLGVYRWFEYLLKQLG